MRPLGSAPLCSGPLDPAPLTSERSFGSDVLEFDGALGPGSGALGPGSTPRSVLSVESAEDRAARLVKRELDSAIDLTGSVKNLKT